MINASDGRTVRVCAESGEGLLVIDGVPSCVRKLTISPDNRRIAFYFTIEQKIPNSRFLTDREM